MYFPSWHLENGETWLEFLQRDEQAHVAHDAAGTIRTTIDAQTMQIVGTRDELQKAGFRLVERVVSGLHEISWTIADTNASIRDLTAAVQVGFEGLTAALHEVSKSLHTISDAATSPAVTVAREQYSIALQLFDLGRYAEALKHIERGIDHYPLGFRYQFLLGTIRLGSPRNTDPRIVDTKKAEEAFLLSAERAKQKGKNKFAAVAMLNASFAAYTQRELDDAITHADTASDLDPDFLDAHFRLGQLRMAEGSVEAAVDRLDYVVKRDARYGVLAASDRDYQRDPVAVSDALRVIRYRKEQEILPLVQEVVDAGVGLLKYFPKLADDPTFQWAREFWKDHGKHTLLELEVIHRSARVSELRAMINSFRKLRDLMRDVYTALRGVEQASEQWVELREHPRVLEWCAIVFGKSDWDLERALKYYKSEFAAVKEDVRGKEAWLKRRDAANARLRRVRSELEPLLALASDYLAFVAWCERVRDIPRWTRIPPDSVSDAENHARKLEGELEAFEGIRASLKGACRGVERELSDERRKLTSVREDVARCIRSEKRRCRFQVYLGAALFVPIVVLTALVFDIYIGEKISTELIGRWWEPASGAWSLAAFGACLCAWIAYLWWRRDICRELGIRRPSLEECLLSGGFAGFFAGAASGWLADIYLPPFRYKAALLAAPVAVATVVHFVSSAREKIAKIRAELESAEEVVLRTLPERVAQHRRWLRELSPSTRVASGG